LQTDTLCIINTAGFYKQGKKCKEWNKIWLKQTLPYPFILSYNKKRRNIVRMEVRLCLTKL
jgi:hypothetical protein